MWWAVCTGAWIVSLSAISVQEVVVAALAAVPCGILATAARRVAGNAWRVRPAWLVPVAGLPIAIPLDTIRVLAAALRLRPVEFAEVPVREAAGVGPGPAGRRALATILLSTSPRTIVADVDPETGTFLVHRYGGGESRIERRLTA